MTPEEYSSFIEDAVDRIEDLLDVLGLSHGAAIDVLINVLIDECAMKEDLNEAEVDDILLSIADGIEETVGIGNSVIWTGNIPVRSEGCNCDSCDGSCDNFQSQVDHDVTDRELDEDFDDMEGK
ncbi:MAG: hypothetical protein J5897_05760 [Candidatus Methanomethylophilus sp.]|nr:hypothetical protein [Methanomethylophilus sp.]